jgi:hypothetical protein
MGNAKTKRQCVDCDWCSRGVYVKSCCYPVGKYERLPGYLSYLRISRSIELKSNQAPYCDVYSVDGSFVQEPIVRDDE